MKQKVFLFLSFILIGVAIGSIPFKLVVALIWLLAFSGLLLLKKKLGAILWLGIMIGASYYWFDAFNQKPSFLASNEVISFSGLVTQIKRVPEKQTIDVLLFGSKIRLTTDIYPVINYGDEIFVKGFIRSIPKEASGYFRKEKIQGLMYNPKEIRVVASNKGFFVKDWLFSFRDRLQENLEKRLLPQQAVFVSGLLIGKSAGFSLDFLEKLKLTGTTHLIALSGYNVTIVAVLIMKTFQKIFSIKTSLALSLVGIMLFVIMTGAQASVTRAALMASVLFVSEYRKQDFPIHYLIILAALTMVIFNPHLLIFDLGFQLSFLALLGVIYLKPTLEKIIPFFKESGFLAWRENLITTFSAQALVLPLVLSQFGFFSVISLLTNVLLLTFIPLTMLLGFLVAAIGFLSSFVSELISYPTSLLVGYELWVINFFSNFSLSIKVASFPLVLSILYYLYLLWIIRKKY